MVSSNVKAITFSNQTAFTISIDAAPHLGVTTGISAEDRARTIQVAINPATKLLIASPWAYFFPSVLGKERCPGLVTQKLVVTYLD